MKVLLINPYYSVKKEYYFFSKPVAPLALMYLAGYLRKFGVKSQIVELGIFKEEDALVFEDRIRFGISDRSIYEILKKERPEIVGITSMYSVHYRDVMEIAETIKNFSRGIKVVVGGNHPSSYFNYILKDKNIDFVVIGEGERTLLELCRVVFQRKKNYAKIKGIAFKKGKKIVKTEPRELISSLDEIPLPARDLVDFPKYVLTEKETPYLMRYPATSMVTSRGCPGHCVYCTVRAVWGRTWRGRSPGNVVDEIEELIKKYGIKEIAFQDDSASVDKKRWNEICDEIIKRKIDFRWTTPNGIAHWTLDKPLLKKMKRAGCYRITFGIESGNIETRNFLGKPYPLSQAKELIQYANKIGLWTLSTNILGFPYEKIDSIKETIEFNKKSGVDFAMFYLLTPFPTADVYEYFKKEKLLNFDHFFEDLKINADELERIYYVLGNTGADTKFFKKEQLREIQKKAYQDFISYRAFSYLLNPLKIINKIHSKEDLIYLLKLLSRGIKIGKNVLSPKFLKSSGDFLYKDKKKNVVKK